MNRWKKSRAGAWAARGFHYQHLFTTLILVRQWAGLAPTGWIVPEGLEDCVVELPDREVWIQIKSRESGTFSEAEVKAVLAEVGRKAALVKSRKKTQMAVGLEQPYSGAVEHDLDQLFGGATEKVVVCGTPEEEIIALLSDRLDTAEIIAEGLASDLYKFVADISAANAPLSFEKRKRISTTEIERRIFERLEAEDPSAINFAFVSRSLEPVDFITPISEPGFYQGVKTKPGHVAAGLVLRRPTETNSVISLLKNQRHVLLTGPSGAGKSSLMWLVANSLAAEFRWFQITAKAGAQDADAIVRFVRARRPKKLSPISLVFDEVGASNSDLWDILVSEFHGLPDVYFLGSVRKEDVNLIANQSDTAFFEVTLDEMLAQSIWVQLTHQKQTTWSHWRESFEQSDGLMLEYVHLLTQGERLAALIGEQVRQREKGERHDELSIIRSTAVLCARGGEIEAKTLFVLLELSPERASQALKRLIDEHLVRESRPGVLGGLHTLRSKALVDASHDDMVYYRVESLWRGIRASTTETLPRIIKSMIADTQDETEEDVLRKLAEILADNNDTAFLAAILTGLGLGTLERHIASFMSILERHGVQRAQWSLASMFADVSINVPDLSQFEQWQNLRNAILEFRALPKQDLRTACLEMLPEVSQVPACNNLQQANQLLSCMVPIAGGEPIPMTFVADFPWNGEHDIRDVAALLSTAYLIGPDFAQNFASKFGGEQTLLSWFRSQTPWIATPILEPDGRYGRTVRADWFLVAEDYQSDPHRTVCNICETLIALSPASEAAASDAVDPSGQAITVGGYKPWSKNMPRENLPAKTRVAWNVAFRQILLARAAADSLTDYTRQMAILVRRTEKLFRFYSEKWMRVAKIANADKLVDEINEIIEQVNSLAYAIPETPASSMARPTAGTGTDDKLGAFLTSVLGNLAPRMGKIPAESGAKAAATFAGNLAAQAQEHGRSPIWRTTSTPPLAELSSLAKRLTDIACILHEMAHDSTATTIAEIVKAAKKGGIGKAIRSAARRCNSLAEKRFREKLRSVENALNERGWTVKCWTRPIDEADSIYWPPMEIAVLVEIEDFETDVRYIEETFSVGQEQFGQDWRFRVVPVINGQVVPGLALLPSSQMPLPDPKFAKEWQSNIDLPFLSSETSEAFEQAVKACGEISAILNCRDLENLHPEEDDVLCKAIDAFKRNRLWHISTKPGIRS
jgi:energy-coupling factor transporter ATP-binding protein EcfA2